MITIKRLQSKRAKLVRRMTVLSIGIAAMLIAFFATTNAFGSITGQAPKYSFTTTIVGVNTNVITTPVTINGGSFTRYKIQNYFVQSSNCGTVSISASNFLPGDYVEFQVTITNTGSETLAFQPFTYSCYFVDKSGVLISPPYSTPVAGYPAPIINQQKTWTLTNFGTDTLATYLTYLDGSRSANWLTEFSYTGATTLPTTLVSGATFTYNLYLGLGSNVPYGLPGDYFSLSIPLATPCVPPTPCPTPTSTPTPTPKPTVCPTTTPKQTVCPTLTPKPTCTPKPTPTVCPTPTPKPTSTPTPIQTPSPTPKPTCVPKPTPTTCPTSTPKPTATPTHSPCPTPKPITTPTPKPTPK